MTTTLPGCLSATGGRFTTCRWVVPGHGKWKCWTRACTSWPTTRCTGSSPKTDHVRDQMEGIADLAHPEQLRLLRSVLADHSVPPAVPTSAGKSDRPVELAAACVHTDGYGTRSAALVSVPAEGFPHMWVADGPPCRTPFIEVDEPWSTSA